MLISESCRRADVQNMCDEMLKQGVEKLFVSQRDSLRRCSLEGFTGVKAAPGQMARVVRLPAVPGGMSDSETVFCVITSMTLSHHKRSESVMQVASGCEDDFYLLVRLFTLPTHYFFLPLGCRACGILVPRPETEPVLPAVKEQTPNYWITRKCPLRSTFIFRTKRCIRVAKPGASNTWKHLSC